MNQKKQDTGICFFFCFCSTHSLSLKARLICFKIKQRNVDRSNAFFSWVGFGVDNPAGFSFQSPDNQKGVCCDDRTRKRTDRSVQVFHYLSRFNRTANKCVRLFCACQCSKATSPRLWGKGLQSQDNGQLASSLSEVRIRRAQAGCSFG